MPVILPPKIFQILAPAIKGNVGVAHEVKFAALMRAFTGHFGCTLDQRKGHLVKVSPPALGQGLWDWSRVPFFVHKPANGTLDRQDLYRLQKTFKALYDWDNTTFAQRGGRE